MALLLKRDWCAHCREAISLRQYAPPHPLPGFPPPAPVDLWVTGNGAFPGDQKVCEHHIANDDIGSYLDHEPAGISLVTVVWSSYGHDFLSSDGETGSHSCMRCGAEYILRVEEDANDPSRGEYVNNRGETPMDCVELRDLVHGIERHCERDNGKPCNGGSEPCEHTDHDCNCCLCD